ncbi:MAG: molybdopterin-dependent oxidoreductase [Phenylobacterium sp.]|uniref:molybdopterin-dependent oxidoreductase n=1 Tax=Phenylobacterium sp. TaxID=1871053 RepID=UPI0039197A22
MRAAILLAGAALALAAGPAPAQSITVTGLDGAEKTLSAQDLAALPRARVEAPWGDKPRVFEGPKLTYVLRAAGVPVGARMHGDPMMSYVTVTGADGFAALYALPELDDGFHAGPAILADTADGAKLTGKEAPYRLVMSGDRKPWRSVYAVDAIAVLPAGKAAPMAEEHGH